MSRELGQHRIGRPDIRRALRILRTGPAIEGIAPAMVGCFEGSELCSGGRGGRNGSELVAELAEKVLALGLVCV
jgi:hypothetical protein